VDSKIQSSTDKCVFRYRQSNVRRLPPASDYCRTLFRCLNCAQRFDYLALGGSRKLGGAAEHLIDGSEKRICRLSFEFWSPHVIERRSKIMINARCCRIKLHQQTNYLSNRMSPIYLTLNQPNNKELFCKHLLYI